MLSVCRLTIQYVRFSTTDWVSRKIPGFECTRKYLEIVKNSLTVNVFDVLERPSDGNTWT